MIIAQRIQLDPRATEDVRESTLTSDARHLFGLILINSRSYPFRWRPTVKGDQRPGRHPGIATLGLASLVLVLFHLSARASPPVKTPTVRRSADLSNKQIVSRATEALVSIEAQSADGIPVAQGSGFFFGQSNRVVTNLHVLKWAHRLVIKRLADQVRYEVLQVAGIDPARDICLLVVDSPPVNGLSPARHGSIGVGDAVIVAGNPRGLEGTFAQGMVSAMRPGLDRIQIDAPISPGSSGGPVLDRRAEVIGIATSSLQSGQLLNFAVPIEAALTLKNLDWTVYAAASLAVRDIELQGLKGRPKQVEEREAEVTGFYPATGKRVEGTPGLRETTVYDESGMVIRHANFGSGVWAGVRWAETRFEYFEAPVPKRLTTFLNTAAEWGGPTEKVTDYSWLTGAEMRSNNVRYGETLFSGDKDGPAKRLRGEVSSLSYWSTTYDDYGRVVAQVQYGLNAGKERMDDFKSATTYNDHGWKHEYRLFSIDGEPRKTWTYTYEVDKEGNWITQITWFANEKAPTGRSPVTATYRAISYY